MNPERSLPDLPLIDSILALADAFGVFASIASTQRNKLVYCWQNGRFLDRSQQHEHIYHLTIRTASGAIGQARTTAVTQARLEQAFHHAMRNACEQPAVAVALDRLAALEQRQLPLAQLQPLSHNAIAKDFYRQMEAQHRHFFTQPASGSLTTSVTFSHERITAARSDGQLFTTALERLVGTHQRQLPPIRDRQNIQSGVSSTVGFDDALYTGLLHDLALKWQDCSASFTRTEKLAALPVPSSAKTLLCAVLDDQLLGQLLAHCLQLANHLQPTSSAAALFFLQAEGSPAFLPIHPYGYRLATAPVYSSTGTDNAYLAAMASARSLPFHLALALPQQQASQTETATALDACRLWQNQGMLAAQHGCLVLNGVRHFQLNRADGSFLLYPKSLSLFYADRLHPLAAQAVRGSLPALLPSLSAGFGPMRQVWLAGEQWQVADLPRFTLACTSFTLEQGV